MNKLNELQEYVNQATAYICRVKNLPESEVRPKVVEFVKANHTVPKLTCARKNNRGDMEVKTEPVSTYLGRVGTNVLSPSGSIYLDTDKHESLLSKMVTYKIDSRSAIKKVMFKAMDEGDDTTYRQAYNGQTSCKIITNSIPGGMGEMNNFLSNKQGFNSVTAFARTLIANAYSATEQAFGGNFMLASVNDVINHIMMLTSSLPTRNLNIQQVIDNNSMKRITNSELYGFLSTMLLRYTTVDMSAIQQLINTLSQDEMDYIYYYCNLKHIFQQNTSMERVFRSLVWDEIPLDATPRDTSELKDMNEELFIYISTLMGSELKNKNGKYKKVYDVMKEDITVAYKFLNLATYVENLLSSIDTVFDTFIYVPTAIPSIHTKKDTIRNTTVVSDTDSVIYEVDQWNIWIAREFRALDQISFNVCGLLSFWLTRIIANNLEVYSINHGATDKYKHGMVMKPEFYMPVLQFFDAKKVYTSLVASQEGVRYNDLKLDLKGGALRSSTMCSTASDFVQQFTTDEILKPTMNGVLNPVTLIKKVVAFEKRILHSIEVNHESTFLKMCSIKEASAYAKPLTSATMYYELYTRLFSRKYGKVYLPTKCPVVPLDREKCTPEWLAWLKSKHKTVHKHLMAYLDDYGKLPGSLAINPDAPVIPEAIIELIDVKKLVHQNLAPIYLTLRQLHIQVADEKKKHLFYEYYNY